MADVGRQIQVRIAATRPLRGRPSPRLHGRGRKGVDWWPADPHEFLAGGMSKIEWLAGQRARDEAIRNEREFWLPRLENWREEHRDDPHAQLSTRRSIACAGHSASSRGHPTRSASRPVAVCRPTVSGKGLPRTDYRPLPSPA